MSEQPFWQRHAGRYDRSVLTLNTNFPRLMESLKAAIRSSDTVLEVACGTGLLTQSLTSARSVLATDLDERMLALARERLAGTSVKFRKLDATAVASLHQKFDVIVCGNLLHLVDDPVALLRTLGQSLSDGGRLLAPTFCHGAGMRARLISHVLFLFGFPVKHRFTRARLTDTISEAGFTIRQLQTFDGLLPLVFPEADR